MPIPTEDPYPGLSFPAAEGPDKHPLRRLATGYLVHYVKPDSSHLPTIICNVNPATGIISVDIPDATKPAGKYEQTGVPYDPAFSIGSWHWPSDG